MIYDLHSHTTASDGSLSPEELVLRADVRQLHALAITDHDTMVGLEPALNAIQNQGLKVNLINGVEISTSWHGFEIHIVGLCVDRQDQILTDCLNTQIKHRELRAVSIGEKLAKIKIDGIYDLAKQKAGGQAISRTHFAQVLVEKGVVSSFEQAFKKYLGKGKKAYVTAHWMDIESAIKIIKQAGGIPVIAHPARYDMSNKWMTKLIVEFAQLGGEAIEVGLSQQSLNQKLHLSKLARENNLYSSQGSDFHHITKWSDLGRNLHLTEKCLPIWQHPKWRFA